jgi:hypothetical protein
MISAICSDFDPRKYMEKNIASTGFRPIGSRGNNSYPPVSAFSISRSVESLAK